MLTTLLPQRVDNFKFKGLPGQFNEHGEKIFDEYGKPLNEGKNVKVEIDKVIKSLQAAKKKGADVLSLDGQTLVAEKQGEKLENGKGFEHTLVSNIATFKF